MKYNIDIKHREAEDILNGLSQMIASIDRVGSGFEGIEETALALLLYFKMEKGLDKLAYMRKIIMLAMESQLSEEKFDEIIEKDIVYWKPPYEASKDELLKMLKKG